MNFAKQLYDRAMQDLQGSIKQSFQFQEKPILGEINGILDKFGVDGAVSILNDAISFSQSYSGREVYWGDIFEVLNDLRNDDYPHLQPNEEMRDSTQFQGHARELSQSHQLAMFTTDNDGNATRLDASVHQRPAEPPSMLEQALSHHKEQLRVAERDGDEAGAHRARSTLDLIQRDIDRQSPAQPQQPQPQVSPEQAARTEAADKEYHESVQRHDTAQGAPNTYVDDINDIDNNHDDFGDWDE